MAPRFRLIPWDEQFFDLFDRGAQNILEGARLFCDLLEGMEDVDRKARHLKDIEHTGDEITHAIFGALNRTFVTPLDREDISGLASALDNVIDWIEEPARRIQLYHIRETTSLARQFGHVILDQAEQIAAAVPSLRVRKYDDLERAIHEIRRLENEGDDLLAEALATVYEGVVDIPQVIQAKRWSDIYELMEDATDYAENVADVLHSISLKHG